MFPNIKVIHQLHINYGHNLPLLDSSIIIKILKNIKLLSKHLNDHNIQMTSQPILDFVFYKTQCIETSFIFCRTKNLHNYNSINLMYFEILYTIIVDVIKLLSQVCEV
jgi:hypothetical protein